MELWMCMRGGLVSDVTLVHISMVIDECVEHLGTFTCTARCAQGSSQVRLRSFEYPNCIRMLLGAFTKHRNFYGKYSLSPGDSPGRVTWFRQRWWHSFAVGQIMTVLMRNAGPQRHETHINYANYEFPAKHYRRHRDAFEWKRKWKFEPFETGYDERLADPHRYINMKPLFDEWDEQMNPIIFETVVALAIRFATMPIH